MKKICIYVVSLLVFAAGFFFLQLTNTRTGKNTFSTDEEMNVPVPADLKLLPAGGFHADYAVPPSDRDVSADGLETCFAVMMVDQKDKRVVVSKNPYKRIYPASTTKIMTAILVMDAINAGKLSKDDVITLDHEPDVSDPDAVRSDLSEGCSITVRNLLYGMLIRSYNDYAVILAEAVGGDVDTFVSMMNSKAEELDMVGTHYVNPHGLHDSDHYTTAYDMYLLMQKAAEYPDIREIDQNRSFSYTYRNAYDEEMSDEISPTNSFLAGTKFLPSNIEIQEWKTGTTQQAGHVLTMNCTIDGVPYTIYCADAEDDLYGKYSILFNK